MKCFICELAATLHEYKTSNFEQKKLHEKAKRLRHISFNARSLWHLVSHSIYFSLCVSLVLSTPRSPFLSLCCAQSVHMFGARLCAVNSLASMYSVFGQGLFSFMFLNKLHTEREQTNEQTIELESNAKCLPVDCVYSV